MVTKLRYAALALVLFLLTGNAWATTYTGTLSTAATQFSSSPQSITLSSVSWTLTNNGGFYGFDATKGQQIGSSGNPATSMTFATSGITGTVTSVKVTTSGASSVAANVAVTVGGSAFGGAAQSITSTSTTYTFTGSASAGAISINWSQTSSKALYIKDVQVVYTTTYTLTYSGNSNTSGTAPVDASSPYTSGASVTTLTNSGTLARTGYSFSGWNTAADGSGTSYAVNSAYTMPAANTTLYAKWTGSVTYSNNNFTSGTAPTDATAYLPAATVTVLGNTGTLARTGFTFNGWNSAANGSGTNYAPTSTFSFAGNITLYPKWTAGVTYSSLNSTGGNAPTDASAYLEGGSVTVLGNTGSLVRSGYNFSGWNTASDGSGTTYTAGQTFTISSAGNVTLYPLWTLATSPSCPTSTGISSTATQNKCVGVAGDQLTASANISAGTGTPTVTYQWYYNTTNSNTILGATSVGTNSSTFTPPTTATEAGTDRYYFCVAYSTNNGCGQTNATQSLASSVVRVTVTATPVAPTISSPSIVCASSTGNSFSVSNSGVYTSPSYGWTVSGTGWSGTSSTSSISVTAGATANTGSVSCIVTVAGCPSSSGSSGNITPTAKPATPTISVPSPICASSTGNSFSVSNSASYTSPSYAWTVSGTNWSGSSTTSSISVTAGTNANVGTVSCIVTDGGCASTSGGSGNVTPIAIPVTPTISAPTTVCASTAGTFSVSNAASYTSPSYAWTVTGTNWSGTSSTSSISVTPGTTANTGSVSCIVTVAGCASASGTSGNITPTAVPGTPTITTPSPLCVGAGNTFTASGSGTYTWTFTGGSWAGTSTTSSVNVTTGGGAGSVSVKVTTNGCTSGTATTGSITATAIPSTPTANAANAGANPQTTGVATNSFDPNWSAISGATSYTVNVYTGGTVNTLAENFAGFTTTAGTNDRSGSLDTYMQTTGWTGAQVYEDAGRVKMGSSGSRGILATTLLDFSAAGSATLTFDLAKFGSDATTVQVQVNTGFGYSTVSTITAPASMTTQTVSLTGLNATTNVRIQASSTSSSRFYIDNFLLTTTSYAALTTLTNLTGTSTTVGSLNANTQYYYTVTAVNACGSSAASGYMAVSTTAGPTLTAGTLTAFGTLCYNSTPADNTFTLSGNSLNGSNSSQVTISTPSTSAYTVSTDGTNFSHSVNYTYSSGSFGNINITVRFRPVATSTYDNISISGGGATASVTTSGGGTTAPAQPTPSAGSTTACASSSTNAYSVTSVAGVTYAWTFTGGFSGSASGSSNTITAPASGSGTVVVTPSIGSCTGSAYTWNVTVPTVSQPSVINTPGTPCASSTGNVYSVTNVGGVTYAWSVTGTGWSIPSASTTNSVTVTAGTGAGTVTVVPSVSGCTGTSRSTASITPSSSFTATVSIANNNGNSNVSLQPYVCTNSSNTFTATRTDANGGTPSYVWKVNGTTVSSGSATYSPTAGTLVHGDAVTCDMTISGASCAVPATVTSNTLNAQKLAYSPTSIFTETLGTSTNGDLGTYSGYSNGMSGVTIGGNLSVTGCTSVPDIRASNPLSTTVGGSGGSYIFFPTYSTGGGCYKVATITGINTANAFPNVLSFNLYNNGVTVTSSDFIIEYSIDGGSTYKQINYTSTASATAWYSISVINAFPKSTSLNLRFSNTIGAQLRLDDIVIQKYTVGDPAITTNPSTPTYCSTTNSTVLTASPTTLSYAWSSSPTTPSYLSSTSGNSATVTNAATTSSIILGVTDGFGCSATASQDVTINTPSTWYLDADGDGWYTSTQSACSTPGTGWTSTLPSGGNGDCAPNDNTKHASFNFYADGDGDGYGSGSLVSVCAVNSSTAPTGYSTNNTDCDDADATIHPGATEIMNDNIDQDCNGTDLTGGYTWDGSTSTVWTDVTNWTPQPAVFPNSSTTSVIIPTGAPRYPVIDAGSYSVKDIQLQTGATLAINNTQTLSVYGDWTGSASATASTVTTDATGAVVFAGGAAQTISNRTSFAKLTINKTTNTTATVTGNVSIVTSMTMQSGKVNNNNGTVTLKSNANGTAYFDNFTYNQPAGNYIGNLTVERYVASSGTHYIGYPFTSYGLSFPGGLAGPVLPQASCNANATDPNSPHSDIYKWEETTNFSAYNCSQRGWVAVTNENSVTGRGYAVSSGIQTLALSGTPILGDYNFGVTKSNYTVPNPTPSSGVFNPSYINITGGTNLVANPYPSPYEWDGGDGLGGLIDDVAYVWQTTGTYKGSYQPIVASATSHPVIAIGQGFFVKASGSTTLSFTNAKRRATNNPTFYQANNGSNLDITVAGNGFADRTQIVFNDQSTLAYDGEFDGFKMLSNYTQPTLYTVMSGSMMASINTLPSIDQSPNVTMGMFVGTSGNYELTFNNINSFDPTSYIYLEDTKTNTMQDMRANNTYSFSATTSDAADRFVVHFTPALEINATDATCNASGVININQPGSANWAYTVTDNNNATTISSGTLNQNTPVTVSAVAGTYTLTLVDNNNYTVMKTVTVNGNTPIAASFTPSTTTVEETTDVTFNSTTNNATTYAWDFGDGTTANTANATHAFTTAGTYTVSFTVTNATGCSSTTTQVITVTEKTTTGMNTVTANNKIGIWSAENRVFIDFSKQTKVEATIEFYNVLGQQLTQEKFGRSTIFIKELSNIEAAYVIVKVKNEDVVTTKKVFIMNK